ncbi:MAG: hypothetical protein AAFX40_03740 [Cyanobacteria bacterium J06639_1]
MYLFRARNTETIQPIIDDLENIVDFPHCDLGYVNTLTLTELTDEYVDWIVGSPIAYDEGRGLAIVQFSESTITWLHNNSDVLSEYGVDIEALKSFANIETDDWLFALDTF